MAKKKSNKSIAALINRVKAQDVMIDNFKKENQKLSAEGANVRIESLETKLMSLTNILVSMTDVNKVLVSRLSKTSGIDEDKVSTISSATVRPVKKGDSTADVLSKIYTFFTHSKEEDKKKAELERNFEEGKASEAKNKNKKTTKVDKVDKPTSNPIVSLLGMIFKGVKGLVGFITGGLVGILTTGLSAIKSFFLGGNFSSKIGAVALGFIAKKAMENENIRKYVESKLDALSQTILETVGSIIESLKGIIYGLGQTLLNYFPINTIAKGALTAILSRLAGLPSLGVIGASYAVEGLIKREQIQDTLQYGGTVGAKSGEIQKLEFERDEKLSAVGGIRGSSMRKSIEQEYARKIEELQRSKAKEKQDIIQNAVIPGVLSTHPGWTDTGASGSDGLPRFKDEKGKVVSITAEEAAIYAHTYGLTKFIEKSGENIKSAVTTGLEKVKSAGNEYITNLANPAPAEKPETDSTTLTPQTTQPSTSTAPRIIPPLQDTMSSSGGETQVIVQPSKSTTTTTSEQTGGNPSVRNTNPTVYRTMVEDLAKYLP